MDSLSGQLLQDYFFVLAFVVVGIIFGFVPIVISLFISPRTRGVDKLTTYESGMTPIGQAWIQFGVAYYLYALIFLAFDVDVLFLFPALTAFGAFPWRDLITIAVFIVILALAVVYAWCKGVFKW
ncbi:MAG: NADH-quinone oxidoreductase subunit A [Desulfobacteraceae bacterium]|nr:MAG: NADH-quinone oxidoreductase subunit A [Desulfobacteraceae bacterium]